ncbi:MAG: 1-acyl-sn-glycerol-3-phosphate acyltransferase [Geminicoccaceae bacterium]|nr:1-acyl-sn-glycerol-3-phosphate acyltransferase [Geminicoccaceae bacterium]
MRHLRSLLFNIYFPLWTAIVVLGFLPRAPFSRPHELRALAAFWQRGVQWGLRRIVGLGYEATGLENIPKGPVVFASKHQSAWDTVFINTVRRDTVIGLKEELTRIFLFGWYLKLGDNIVIDRKGAAKAMRSLIQGTKRAVAQGNSIMIFPEGTRTAPGAPPDYRPGIAALYRELGVPVVPVALNSGLFWGRRSFTKKPGTIRVRFLPPIEPGLERKAFMALLEERIETAVAGLPPPPKGPG